LKIYTKTGDDGQTGLFGGTRVSKADPRVEAYGAVDETNAVIGWARASDAGERLDALLAGIQTELFVLGAEFATPPGHRPRLGLPLIDAAAVQRLEHAIDALELDLEPLRNFVLPGGCRAAAALHLARTCCRRAERALVLALGTVEPSTHALIYLNRLSDLLFVMARHANHTQGVADVPWQPRS
jgi:cob(I)alamin adenosyltransferase